MAFEFHKDKQRYFNMQYENSKEYVLPFVKDHLQPGPGKTVLEIGSAEGGSLKSLYRVGLSMPGH